MGILEIGKLFMMVKLGIKLCLCKMQFAEFSEFLSLIFYLIVAKLYCKLLSHIVSFM